VSIERFSREALPADISGRILAEASGNPIGFARYARHTPGAYRLDLITPRAGRTLAVEAALCRGVAQHLQTLPARKLLIFIQEDEPLRQEALERTGFELRGRSYGTNLDISRFDASHHSNLQTLEERLASQGVTVHTYAELAPDDKHTQKLYALFQETEADFPEVGSIQEWPSFEEYLERFKRETFLPEGFFIATANGEYVGRSELWTTDDSAVWSQEATVVKPAYRRQGIALALKLRGIQYAKARSIPTLNTGMAAHNTPIVTLNEKLGFVPIAEPSWLTFRLTLEEE
jgi:GNAT superfamily N-acetyltransferase